MVIEPGWGVYHQVADTGAGSAPAGDPDAGDGSGEETAGEGGGHTVPFERFDEVNEERKQALLRAQEAEAKVERLTAAAQDTGNGDGTATGRAKPASARPAGGDEQYPVAPEGLGRLESVYWYINQGLRRELPRLLKEMTGVEPQQLGEAAESSHATAQVLAAQQYRQLCENAGVDPENPIARQAFRAFQADGLDPDKAIAEIRKHLPASKKSPSRTATPITGGVDSPVTSERVMPRGKEHATKLAMEGKRVPEFSVLEIFAARDEK